jgi:microcystin-dependent protein
MSSYVRGAFTLNAHQKATVGDSKFSVIGNDHLGWLKCDGRSLSKDQFYLLWRVIGYSFGGSGDNFNLPNAAGTVPGVVGTGTDSNVSSFTFTLGQQVGEYNHRLTIAEMPTHNHGVEADPQPNNNQTSAYTHSHRLDGAAGTGGLTSNSATGITVNNNATGVTDSGHAHSYVNQPNDHEVAVSATTTGSADNVDVSQTTGTSSANIVDPTHAHSITDPTHNHAITADTHFHTINSAGGSNIHNNVQPTLPIGHMFMYCGKPTYPLAGFPYTEGTTIL